MADLNEGTRQRNLRQLSGSANVPNQLRNLGGGIPAPSTDLIQALGGHIGGWWIENQRLTADGGNAKLNANVPSISLGAATDYVTGVGIWMGKDSAVYKARIGDPGGNCLKWDGATLTVVGTISATAGMIGGWTIGTDSISADSGAAVIDSSVPKITLGAASDYLTGTGFFVGKDSGSYKLRIGDPEGNCLKWDGSTGALMLNGTVTTNSLNPALQSFTTNIVFSSINNTTVSWTAGTIRLASGMTYSIVAGSTGSMAALTYIYLDTAVSTTALQTTTSYSNAVGDNRLLLAAAQNHGAGPAGASVIPYTGQQPIVNGTDQIAAQSIVAGNIAAGAITADKINVTSLSAINANLGNITAGTITGGLIRTAASGARVQMDGICLAGYGADGVTKEFYLNASDGKAYAGNGAVHLDSGGVSVVVGTTMIPTRAYRFVDGASLTGLLGGYADANSVTVDLNTQQVTGKHAFIYVTADAPSGKSANVIMQAMGLSGGSILTLAVSGTASTAEIEAGATYITGGLNAGTATGAGAGDVKGSGSIVFAGSASSLAQPSWTDAALFAGWANFGAPYSPAGYFKDSLGIVHIRGLVKSGTGTILNLPAGFRPTTQLIFATDGNAAFARVDITTSGYVSLVVGNASSYLSLDGIQFRT